MAISIANVRATARTATQSTAAQEDLIRKGTAMQTKMALKMKSEGWSPTAVKPMD